MNITKVAVCKLDLFKDGQIMDSEVKRIYRTTKSAIDYIQTQVNAYMSAYNGIASIKENHGGFVEILCMGWVRRYYYVLKTLEE